MKELENGMQTLGEDELEEVSGGCNKRNKQHWRCVKCGKFYEYSAGTCLFCGGHVIGILPELYELYVKNGTPQ